MPVALRLSWPTVQRSRCSASSQLRSWSGRARTPSLGLAPRVANVSAGASRSAARGHARCSWTAPGAGASAPSFPRHAQPARRTSPRRSLRMASVLHVLHAPGRCAPAGRGRQLLFSSRRTLVREELRVYSGDSQGSRGSRSSRGSGPASAISGAARGAAAWAGGRSAHGRTPNERIGAESCQSSISRTHIPHREEIHVPGGAIFGLRGAPRRGATVAASRRRTRCARSAGFRAMAVAA